MSSKVYFTCTNIFLKKVKFTCYFLLVLLLEFFLLLNKSAYIYYQSFSPCIHIVLSDVNSIFIFIFLSQCATISISSRYPSVPIIIIIFMKDDIRIMKIFKKSNQIQLLGPILHPRLNTADPEVTSYAT